MAGAGESYFSAYAVFLKASTSQIGFLASVPPLLASFIQLLSAWLGHKTGHRKRIILAGAIGQGFSWVPLAILPLWFPDYAVPLMIASVVLYYASGNLTIPQWTSMMGDLVDERKRGRYFALRTKIASLTSFVALIAAGYILHWFDEREATLNGYFIIFTVACVARVVSIYHLAMMYDPPAHSNATEAPVDDCHWSQWLRSSTFLHFSLFFALIQFSVAVASPFFSVYLLRDLHFSYMEFMVCTAAAVLIQFLTLNRWGRISDVFGNRVTMIVCGSLIPLIPLMWIFSGNFYYLLFTQALSGFAWAGFNLSASNYLYELIPANRRVTFLALHNVAAGFGVFFGAMLGGVLGSVLPQHFTLFGIEFDWLTALYNIFILSFLLRLLTVVMFLPRIREMRRKRRVSPIRLIFRINRFNPLTGFFFDIVGSRRRTKLEKESDQKLISDSS
ncbi:MAG: MFS transporter [Gammaproteobacteria bacterium]|nr:MFS transporter [Gammaproteobacteria bacterium]